MNIVQTLAQAMSTTWYRLQSHASFLHMQILLLKTCKAIAIKSSTLGTHSPMEWNVFINLKVPH